MSASRPLATVVRHRRALAVTGLAPSSRRCRAAAPRSAPAAAACSASRPANPTLFDSADKEGFGTAYGTRSKVWFTLARRGARPTSTTRPTARRVCAACSSSSPTAADLHRHRGGRHPAPDPAPRSTQPDLPADQHREVRGTTGSSRPTSATRRRATVLVRIRFVSLTGKPYQVYVDHLPALDNAGDPGPPGAAVLDLVAAGPRSFSALRRTPDARSARPTSSTAPDGGLAQLEAAITS